MLSTPPSRPGPPTLQQEDGVVTLRGVLEVPTGPLTCREPPALASTPQPVPPPMPAFVGRSFKVPVWKNVALLSSKIATDAEFSTHLGSAPGTPLSATRPNSF